jgi:hypothetical protein
MWLAFAPADTLPAAVLSAESVVTASPIGAEAFFKTLHCAHPYFCFARGAMHF